MTKHKATRSQLENLIKAYRRKLSNRTRRKLGEYGRGHMDGQDEVLVDTITTLQAILDARG